MLTHLRNTKLINTTGINIAIYRNEEDYRLEFKRFLMEIPYGFQDLPAKSNKKALIEEHLKLFYKKKPKSDEIDTVLERVTNLAQIVALGRDAVEDKVKQNKFKNDNWTYTNRCVYCGHEFIDVNDVTLDHIIPLSLGGSEKEANWTLSCRLCNEQKKEYWGVADISQIEAFRRFQGNFFGLTAQQAIEQLGASNNPARYWVLERDGCQCVNCGVGAKENKLYIACKAICHLVTVDNLSCYCINCINALGVTVYCE